MRDDLAATLRRDELAPGFVRPDYDGYSFAAVPATAASVLGADLDAVGGGTLPGDVFEGVATDVDTVVVLLVDALGWDQYVEARGDHPFFDRLADSGRVTPLTSIYPSETTACVTTMHTGLPPVEHGLLGWDVHDPELCAAVFQPLPWQVRATGEAPGVDVEDLFSHETVYERLAMQGVDAYTVEPHDPDRAPYTAASTAGAESVVTDGVADFALSLRRTVERAAASSSPTYVYAYYPTVDTAAHVAGTRSDRHDAELAALSAALDRELGDRLDSDAAERTLLTMVADHGQVDTDLAQTVNLLEDDVVTDAVGRECGEDRLLFGGPRNVHLRVADGEATRVRDHLDATLDALVFTREEAIEVGLWGPGEPSDACRRRAGDVLVLPRSVQMWGTDDLPYVGQHGGLDRREAVVPFGAARLDALQ